MTQMLYLLTLAVGILLVWMHYRHRRTVKAERAAIFDRCLAMFQSPRVVQDDVNFPVLTGTYRGYALKVEPIADHVAYRKLPSLWLLITVRAEIPYRGVWDFLVRPQNIEFFSPSSQLEERLPIPPEWPQYATLRTDCAAAAPPHGIIGQHMELFDDPRTKELLITPRGVRIVYQANQAQQGNYRVLRGLAFDDLAIDPALLSGLIDRAIAIQQVLSKQPTHESEDSEVTADDRLQYA